MTRADRELARLRKCRAIFERAVSDHVDMSEARRRVAQDRWGASARRLAERRCGTAVRDHSVSSPPQPGDQFFNPMRPSVQSDDERELAWWQK